MLAGYRGGWVDTVVTRGADIISAFPELVFAIMLAAVLGPGVLTVILAPLLVRASIGVGFIITAEATLSFLGLGVQEPLPSWGGMIRDGLTVLRTDPTLAMATSAVLGLTIIGFNLLGDGLRDLLDPRIRDR